MGDLKLKHKDAYMICAISKKKDSKDEEISIEKLVKKADCDNEYLEAFVDALKESGTCRFGVVDWNNKLVFVSWVPDTGKAQDKMKYASVTEAFKTSLVGSYQKINTIKCLIITLITIFCNPSTSMYHICYS